MTDAPPSPNPLADPTVTEDLVPVAGRAVGAEFATAVACLAVVTWGTLHLAAGQAVTRREEIDPGAAYVNLLLYGVFATVPVTAIVGWRLMRPIANTWRRLGITSVGVFGGMALGMVATIAARELGGALALAGLALASGLLAVRLAIAARRVAPRAPVR